MDEYKVYDREEYCRIDRYLVKVSKLKVEIFIAKFKRMILKLQNRRLRRDVERLREK